MGLGRREFLRWVGCAVGTVVVAACDVREFARKRGAKQRLSIATGPVGGVYYVYGGAIAKVISDHVRNVEATAEVTGASGDNLRFVRAGTADVAWTMATTLDDAYRGRGQFSRIGKVPAAALAVLYMNYTHFVTLAGSGIERVVDVKGRPVATGTPNSGTEDVVARIVTAAGLDPARDIRRQSLGVGAAAEAIRDGKIDALFWSSGVPVGPLVDLARTPGRRMRLLPTADVFPALHRSAPTLYHLVAIPRGAYPGLDADVPVVGVSNILVADVKMSESLAYEITRALFEHKSELEAVHAEARNLTLRSAVVGSPVPFHPGAVRFYRERGVWTG